MVVTLRAPGRVGPVVVRLRSSDLQVFRQVFLAKQHEPMLAHIDVDHVSSILDRSANIGLAAVCFLAHCPHAVVVAIEPDDGNVVMLEANLRRFGARALVMRAGVWSGGRRSACEMRPAASPPSRADEPGTHEPAADAQFFDVDRVVEIDARDEGKRESASTCSLPISMSADTTGWAAPIQKRATGRSTARPRRM